jgi:hypothetical protein
MEPNSLEWKSADEGARWELEQECKSDQQQATPVLSELFVGHKAQQCAVTTT